MNILILGGTLFLGRYLVGAALARGHQVTLFNRGKTNAHLFPFVEKLRGDRKKGDFDALKQRRWDAAIDTSCFYPSVAAKTIDALKGTVGHYTLVSTLGVYQNTLLPEQSKEEDPTFQLLAQEIKTGEQFDHRDDVEYHQYYNKFKAESERMFLDAMGNELLTIRPGFIVGPYDDSDRFAYWPKRVAEGGKVLAPGDPDTQVTFIDAKDLALWNIKMVEEHQTGTFNACGAYGQLTMRRFLTECKKVSRSDAEFVWIGDEFLQKYGRLELNPLPYYLSKKNRGMFNTSAEKAMAHGLTFRPLAETIADTLSWIQSRKQNAAIGAQCVSRKKEQQIVTDFLSGEQRSPQ